MISSTDLAIKIKAKWMNFANFSEPFEEDQRSMGMTIKSI